MLLPKLLFGATLFVGCACDPSPRPAEVARAGSGAPSAAPAGSNALDAVPVSPGPARPGFVSAPPVAALPKLYAALFDAGHVWTLSVTTTSSGMDDRGKRTSEKSSGTATCSASEVVAAPFGVVSHVACHGLEANGPDDPVSGVWIATADGLFHARAMAEVDAGALLPANAYLLAAPKESIVEKKDPEHEAFGSRRKVKRDGAGFCVEESEWSGDDSWTTLCFAATVGIRSGSYGWGGGSVHETKFRALP